MFVLKSREYGGYLSDGYYTGQKYTFQGEQYAVCDTDISKAKKYTSLKRAERGAECLNRSVSNYMFNVKEITEEDK